MSITGADVESVSSSRARSPPTNRLKFLCSHGGKILPRPADGRLKYVGGETRVICIHRDVTFPELLKKVTSMFTGEMILKYQLMPDDLDVLVTVKCDEDVRHMIEECNRHEHLGAPRLRAFLFPANPLVMVNHSGAMDRHSLEQRYINSINGIVVHPSVCSSPRTPPDTATNCSINPESTTGHGKSSSLTRTRSSPSLCNKVATANANLSQSHHHHQQPPQPHHLHLQPHQPPPKPPLDRHPHNTSGLEHLGRMRSTGVAEYYSHRTTRGEHMYYQRGSPYDAYFGDCRYDRTESPPSPNDPSSSPGIRSGQ